MYSYFTPVIDDRPTQLRAAVEDVLLIESMRTEQGGVTFTGQLRDDAERAFRVLSRRFGQMGYTPLMRRRRGVDEVVAVEGTVGVKPSNWVINVLLFLATVTSVVLVGRQLYSWSGAVVFMLGLLTVLGVHEFGHYLVARVHGMSVTLPYFIPLPLPPLGTMGAFIRLKSPVENRKALFDMAIAGPLAGFLAALPIFVLGLLLPIEWLRFLQQPRPLLLPLPAESRLIQTLIDLLLPTAGRLDLFRNPLTAVGWFGMLVTAINLLPAGQLDGGHIAYSVLGRWARPASLLTFFVLLVLGFLYWNGWWVWAFLLLITGMNHPMPLNDITRLDWPRFLIAAFTFILFLLIITVRPFAM